MQRHDHAVGRDGRDDARGKRAMNVSRVETVEGGGTKMFQEAGIGLFEKSGIGLFQETRIRLFKKSGIGLLQNCRRPHAAGEKVVSAGQMADQGWMRVVDFRIEVGYDNCSSSRKRRCLCSIYQLHRRLQLVPVRSCSARYAYHAAIQAEAGQTDGSVQLHPLDSDLGCPGW